MTTATAPSSLRTAIFRAAARSTSTSPSPALPGIGRNVFRGPNYVGDDFSFVKQIRFGRIRGLGENAMLDLRTNFFNAFNKLNLAPFNFGDSNTHVEDPTFGRAITGLAGRVVELQGRFSF